MWSGDEEPHQCSLPGVSSDPGRHHHLLCHTPHGDSLEAGADTLPGFLLNCQAQVQVPIPQQVQNPDPKFTPSLKNFGPKMTKIIQLKLLNILNLAEFS